MTPTADEVVATVQSMAAELRAVRALLAAVAEGYVQTSRDDVALVQLPVETFDEIRARVPAPTRF